MPFLPAVRTWHVLALAALACALVARFAVAHPVAAVLGLLAATAAFLAWRVAGWRATLANVTILLAILAGAELILDRLMPPYRTSVSPAAHLTSARPPVIGTDGMRVTPRGPATPARAAWFFGCSVAFGDGVADDQTLPAQFASLAGWRAHNFGVRDSGPHGMLRVLETRGAIELGGPRPVRAFFVLLAGHVARVSGRAVPDLHAPRYVLDAGQPRFAGFMRDIGPRPDGALMRSGLWREVALPVLLRRDAAEDALALAVLMRAHALLLANHGVALEVLLWDIGPSTGRTHLAELNMLESELQERGVNVFRASAAIVGGPAQAVLFADGDRPTAAAYRDVARYLVRSNPPPAPERRAAAIRRP